MTDTDQDKNVALLKAMKEKIAAIDHLAQELNELGKGLPVIEKNVLGIRSFTHALSFGISDLVDG